jgi:hypothetical protein
MNTRGRVRRVRREAQVQTAVPPSERSAEELTERAQRLRQVSEALETLAEPYRSTLLLRYLEEQSVAEIAHRDGIAPGTVRWRTKVGLEMLRVELDRRNGGDRRVWLAALCPIVNLEAVSRPAFAAGALMMKTTTKIAIAIGCLTLGAGLTTTWVSTAETPPPPSSLPTSSSHESPDEAATKATAGVDGTDRLARDRAQWEQLRTRIRRARAHREAARAEHSNQDSAEAPGPPADTPAAAAPLLEAVGEQLVDTLGACIRDVAESAVGSVTLEATVMSESGVGTVVDQVNIIEDTAAGKELGECLMQAIYTLDVQSPSANMFNTMTFDVDLEQGTISASANVDGRELIGWLAQHPELVSDHLSAVEATFTAAPELASEFPAVVQAASEARAGMPIE